jgi:hypothetical protein
LLAEVRRRQQITWKKEAQSGRDQLIAEVRLFRCVRRLLWRFNGPRSIDRGSVAIECQSELAIRPNKDPILPW